MHEKRLKDTELCAAVIWVSAAFCVVTLFIRAGTIRLTDPFYFSPCFLPEKLTVST
jgi:hypothetical protein